jgi:hypothetical protein
MLLIMSKISEVAPKNPNNSNNRSSGRTRRIVGSLTAAAVFFAGGTAGHDVQPTDKLSAQAEAGIETASLAATRAAEFGAALYDRTDYPKGVIMPVLNGEVTIVKAGGNEVTGTYKNPILLATANQRKPDRNGDFLEGAYIGIAGNDADGKAVIVAQPYDPTKEKFTAFGPEALLPGTTGVYPTAVKGGPGFSEDGLVAFDTTGTVSLLNGDGSVVRPGLSLGSK